MLIISISSNIELAENKFEANLKKLIVSSEGKPTCQIKKLNSSRVHLELIFRYLDSQDLAML